MFYKHNVEHNLNYFEILINIILKINIIIDNK